MHVVERDHARLGRAMRDLRVRAGLDGKEAARRAGISQPTISRLERCKTLPTVAVVSRLCEVYNAAADVQAELIRLAESVRETSQRSRVLRPRGIVQLQNEFARLDKQSKLLRSYQPAMVLGILQTVDYARLVMGSELDQDVEDGVAARRARRTALENPRKQFVLIMAEGALRWHAGSPQVMAEQIDAIVEATRLPNVRIGIIPWTRPVGVFCTHAFHLYDSAAVAAGNELETVPYTEPDKVRVYEDLFAELEAVALFGDDARRELVRIGNDYRLLA